MLIFDGDCALCTRGARWLEERWRSPVPIAIAAQRVHAQHPLLDIPSRRELDESLWWLEGSRRDAGAAAVARSLLATSWPWRALGLLLLTPPLSWVASPAYSLLARHRHRLPGASDACARALATRRPRR
ncbi:MAG: DUF393 domain-containing protein [Acidobacteriota bacterium]|nr:DUF393 domain-containing protein [Acidobacteriota bacterium]